MINILKKFKKQPDNTVSAFTDSPTYPGLYLNDCTIYYSFFTLSTSLSTFLSHILLMKFVFSIFQPTFYERAGTASSEGATNAPSEEPARPSEPPATTWSL